MNAPTDLAQRIRAGLLLAIEHAPANERPTLRDTLAAHEAKTQSTHLALESLLGPAIEANTEVPAALLAPLYTLGAALIANPPEETAAMPARMLGELLNQAAALLQSQAETLAFMRSAAVAIIQAEGKQ